MDRKKMVLSMLKREIAPGEVCYSRKSLSRLSALPEEKVLVIAGKSAETNGTLEKAVGHLDKAGAVATVEIYPGGEPTLDEVGQLAARAAEEKADWIVALGGGSIIDSAKFTWAAYEHPELNFAEPTEIPPLGEKAQLIAIPTTSGSGAEGSITAVISAASSGQKMPHVSPEWIPRIVILDPETTTGQPPSLTAQSAFDALAHAFEAYVSRMSSPMVKTHAATAIRLIFNALPISFSNPEDILAREALQLAAYHAGIAQNTASTGIVHGLSHGAGEALKLPHALATAFFLMPGLRYNEAHEKTAAEYDQLAVDTGTGNRSTLFTKVERLYLDTGLPASLAEMTGESPTVDQIEALTSSTAADRCLRTNPIPVKVENLTEILETL